jgi:hypothetical protein
MRKVTTLAMIAVLKAVPHTGKAKQVLAALFEKPSTQAAAK